MKKLIIVESPTKAKTIKPMFGPDYQIMASKGHVRDLPERTIGVDIEHDFAPQYVDVSRRLAEVTAIKKAAKEADEIYLATDPDREGEAIAWHLKDVLSRNVQKPFHRITFHEITRDALARAMENRGEINQAVVDSQQARRILDRIVGYQVSPLLWSKVARGISAGRVQSVALRLIVERERLIEAFEPKEYWNFILKVRRASREEFSVKLAKIDGKSFEIKTADDAGVLLEAILSGAAPVVANVGCAEKKRSAPPPFTTSTLQQTAASMLRFSSSSTMQHAQALYEGVEIDNGGAVGLITYMRTDSMTIAKEAQIQVSAFVKEKFGDEFAPGKFNVYKNKAAAQEAHEAVRPTDIRRTPESLKPYLSDAQYKLYDLIYRRFLASQMTPYRFRQTTAEVKVDGSDKHDYRFRASAAVPVFAGFTAVWGKTMESEDGDGDSEVLGKLKDGEILSAVDMLKDQKFTEPAPHFSEASLIKELDENGIGRPSTYASIVKTILARDYVCREKGQFRPTELGYQVNDFLVAQLPQLFDVGFTAQMESKLDLIEEGQVGWTDMLHQFYDGFATWLKAAKASGAAPEDTSRGLVEWLSSVKFASAPKGASRRNSGDDRFFASVKSKFDRDGKLSSKQYTAMLSLAVKYQDQLKDAPSVLVDDFKAACEEQEARAQKSAAAGVSGVDLSGVFDSFKDVKFETIKGRTGRAFDEKSFFNSLADQSKAGRELSEKQLGVLKRIARKYLEQLVNREQVIATLGMSAEEVAAPTGATMSPAVIGEITELIDKLSQVTKWNEPVKRGRITYDDKVFFASLKNQVEQGRALSDKQLAAFRKLAAKY